MALFTKGFVVRKNLSEDALVPPAPAQSEPHVLTEPVEHDRGLPKSETAVLSVCDDVGACASESAWTKRAFWLFLFAHVLVWTFIPAAVSDSLGLDQAETAFWGHEWSLGTTKHPPLPAWVSEMATHVFGCTVWGQFLIAQIAVAAAFWAVWKLASEMLPPQAALFAVCLLECCPFTTFKSLHLNNNVGLLPCWAFCILFLYRAIQTQRLRYWLLVGIWLGLGMLTKYTTGMLALVLLVFGFLNADTRKCWRSPGPYFAVALAGLIFFPHFHWVASHDFCTVRYIGKRVPEEFSWISHLWFPLEFLFSQTAMISTLLISAVSLVDWPVRMRFSNLPNRLRRGFLAAMFLSPIVLHLILSFLFGLHIEPHYGSPLWMLLGIFILMFFQFKTDEMNWKRAWWTWTLVVSLTVVGWTSSRLVQPYVDRTPRVLFPSHELAECVNQIWTDRFHRPLPIIAGDYFVAGNIAFANPNRPRVYQSVGGDINEMAEGDCPWITLEDFRRVGGIVVWDRKDNPTGMSQQARERLGVTETIDLPTFPYRTRLVVSLACIGIAIIPPSDIQNHDGSLNTGPSGRIRSTR